MALPFTDEDWFVLLRHRELERVSYRLLRGPLSEEAAIGRARELMPDKAVCSFGKHKLIICLEPLTEDQIKALGEFV